MGYFISRRVEELHIPDDISEDTTTSRRRGQNAIFGFGLSLILLAALVLVN